jgi:hypothetical protein
MTDKQWQQEVNSALAGAGLPWRASAAWVEQGGVALCAELVDTRTGKERAIRLSAVVFGSESERRAEIARQLQERHSR